MRGLRSVALAAGLAGGLALAGLPGIGTAQEAQTLADIRQQLTVLYTEIRQLNRELSTTQGATIQQPGASVLERVDRIEAELQRLTARTEQLDFQIQSVVRDGTNRIGDLEFRLCELEPGCDIGSLGDTPSLGGIEPAPGARTAPPTGGPQLAVGEQADFDAAQAALEARNFADAAARFAAHVETYPGGPLTGQAQFLRGEALAQMGETAPAARAYLEAFSQAPSGPQAPAALLKLGQSLALLGQMQDACITLGEVELRFPGSESALAAGADRSRLGCA